MKAEAAYLPSVSTFQYTPRLLDIGSGAGTFARHMIDSGWDVNGVEPFCPIEANDFTVHRKFLSELEETSDPFDAVTAWAVLEHEPNPMAYFKKVAKI